MLGLLAHPPSAAAQSARRMRVKIDSQPQQAAIYVNNKEGGIMGYTPMTLRLPRGTYTIILDLPGFRTVQKPIVVSRSQTFVFTMERQAKPALLDVRAASNDAVGAQLLVDGAAVGTVPAQIEVAPGRHVIEGKKAGLNDYRETVDVGEGDRRQLTADLQAPQRKGSLLVSADVAGADVYVDGARRDSAPALVADLTEGQHTVEVRKDPLPPWKQVVSVTANQQTKVEAKLAANAQGSLRIVSSTPGAEVFVDGEDKGPVNSDIAGVRPGKHIVEVRAAGFAGQTVEMNVGAGEQQVAKLELVPQAAAPTGNTRLRVVTPVPDAEVFVDGASVGRAPVDRGDLPAGKHYIVVRKPGFAEFKREVVLDPLTPTVLTAELAASGTLKVLANIGGAMVLIDGVVVGRTPLTTDVAAGEHLVEVRQPGYVDAKQPFRIDGGEQKVLSADLVPVRRGPTLADLQRRRRSETSFSAVTLDPAHFTADIAGGYVPFGQVRLSVGALRHGSLGIDAGIELRTIGYFTEGGAHAKFQFLQAGPVAIGVDTFIGGGGGPSRRNDFIFEVGLPISLLFGQVVRFTAHPYLQVYSDRNCPSVDDLKPQGESKPSTMSSLYTGEPVQCESKDSPMHNGLPMVNGFINIGNQDPRERFAGARFMLQAVLEIAITENVNVFVLFEGDPVGERQSLTHKFSSLFPDSDTQIYGRAGITLKF